MIVRSLSVHQNGEPYIVVLIFNVNKIYRAIIFSSDDGLYLNIYFNSYREFIVSDILNILSYSSKIFWLRLGDNKVHALISWLRTGRVDEIRFHLIYHTLISLVENRNRDLWNLIGPAEDHDMVPRYGLVCYSLQFILENIVAR